jgi:hypothetical protein
VWHSRLKHNLNNLRTRPHFLAILAPLFASVAPAYVALPPFFRLDELGDLSRFRGSRQVSAYVGLAPRVTNSADTRHHGRLTKRGNPELRWIVSQWAVRLLARGEPQVQHWAASRLRRMHKNKVRLALARRLLVGLYVSHCRGEEFSLDRCLVG